MREFRGCACVFIDNDHSKSAKSLSLRLVSLVKPRPCIQTEFLSSWQSPLARVSNWILIKNFIVLSSGASGRRCLEPAAPEVFEVRASAVDSALS